MGQVISSLIGVDPTFTRFFRQKPHSEKEREGGLSPNSSIFQDVNNEVVASYKAAKREGVNLTQEDIKEFVEESGLNWKDFQDANRRWTKDQQSMEQQRLRQGGEWGQGGIGIVGRVPGAIVGEMGEAIARGFPETAELGKRALSSLMGEQMRQELFFPAQTPLEDIGTKIGAIAIPATKIAKGIGLAGRVSRAPKVAQGIGLGTKSRSRIGNFIKYGGGWSLATTAMEDPSENWVELLSEWKGDSTVPLYGGTVDELFEHMRYNPDDTKAEQYLRAFINNLALEGPLTQLGTLAVGIKKGSDLIGVGKLGSFIGKNAVKYTDMAVPIPIKEAAKTAMNKSKKFASEWFSSRYGLSEEAIEMLISRKGAKRAILTEASQISDNLAGALRQEKPWKVEGITNYFTGKGKKLKKDFLENVVNEALAGDPTALARLAKYPKTLEMVTAMRNNLDSFSSELQGITKGNLQWIIGENLETYLNRSYKIFDDPDYLRGGIKDLDPDVREAAEKLFIREGIAPEDVPAVLRHFTEGLKKGEKDFFLKSLKTQSKTSSILKPRKDVPDEIRALWGEVKDPFTNYINTHRKIANVLAEWKFRDDIAEEALRRGKASTEAYDYGDAVIPIGDLAEEGVERAGAGLGALGGAQKSGVIDPLEGLFVDPAWKKAIDNGMEVVFDDGLGMNSWLKAKGLSQAMATVYSLPTHGVNMMGNMFIMLANGTLDPQFLQQGFKDLTKRYVGQATLGRTTAENIPTWAEKYGIRSWVSDTLDTLPTWTKNINLTDDQLKQMKNPVWARGTIDIRNLTKTQIDQLPPDLRIKISELPDEVHRALNVERTTLKGKAKGGMADRIAYYQRLGIIDSSVGVETLARTAKESLRSDKLNSLGAKILNRNKVTKAVGDFTKYTSDRAVRAYEAEDNIFKIWNFEQLKSAYKKALPNMPEEELDRFVAQRSRDMMPNYNMVPKAFKSARVLPLGNFIAFPLEMLRNGKNILKYAWKDASGQTAKELGITDPKMIEQLRNIGMKRAAGMTAAVVAGDAIKHQSMQIYGVTSEQDRALNVTGLPEWEAYQSRVYTGPIKKDKNGKIKVPYMNLGQIDPQSYWKGPAKQVIAALMNGEDYNEAELNKMFTNAAYNMISPYADPSMLTQTALDMIQGKGVPVGSTLSEKALIYGEEFGKTLFVPRTVDWFTRRSRYNRLRSMKDYKPGEEVTEYGFPISPGQVDIPSLLGFRRKEADLSQGVSWSLNRERYTRDKLMRPFNQLLQTYGLDDPKEIEQAYFDGAKKQWELDKITRGKLRAYEKLGFTYEDILNAITYGGFKDAGPLEEHIFNVQNNIFKPPELPTNMMPFIENVTKAPVDFQRLIKAYNVLAQVPIEKEEE